MESGLGEALHYCVYDYVRMDRDLHIALLSRRRKSLCIGVFEEITHAKTQINHEYISWRMAQVYPMSQQQ